MRRALLFALVLGLAAPAADAAEIVDWGVIRSHDVGVVRAPETTSGVATMSDSVRHFVRTERIEACPGVQFGVFYRSAGENLYAAPVVGEVRHPPFEARRGRLIERMPRTAVAEPRYFGWTFEDDYERVEGEWTVAIVGEDGVAAVKTFTVVKPERCDPPVS